MSFYQLTLDDLEVQKNLQLLPGRTAFIDEYGSFGFDFSSPGVTKYYILCAVVTKDSDLDALHKSVEEVKHNNGLSNAELKSSKIGADYKRRSRIISQLLLIEFRVILKILIYPIAKQDLAALRNISIPFLRTQPGSVLTC